MTYVGSVVVVSSQDGVIFRKVSVTGGVAVGTLVQRDVRSRRSGDGTSEGEGEGGNSDGELHCGRRGGRISVGVWRRVVGGKRRVSEN